METWRSWPYPTPLCTTGRLEKRRIRGGAHREKEREKVRKIERVGEESQRKEVVNESQKDEEGEERGEPRRQRKGEREYKRKRANWWVAGFRGLWLVGWLVEAG